MRHKYYGVPAIWLLTLLAACSSTPKMVAESDFDRSFDFAPVKKIAIQPVDRMEPNMIRISDMQIARITDAMANELVRKGYVIVQDKSKADMFLVWHLVTQEKLDVRSYNSMGYYNCIRCGPGVSDVSVRQFTQGTLIVDMVDPVRNKSVWRSIVEARLRSQPSQEEAAARRTEAVRALFADFPPQSPPAT